MSGIPGLHTPEQNLFPVLGGRPASQLGVHWLASSGSSGLLGWVLSPHLLGPMPQQWCLPTRGLEARSPPQTHWVVNTPVLHAGLLPRLQLLGCLLFKAPFQSKTFLPVLVGEQRTPVRFLGQLEVPVKDPGREQPVVYSLAYLVPRPLGSELCPVMVPAAGLRVCSEMFGLKVAGRGPFAGLCCWNILVFCTRSPAALRPSRCRHCRLHSLPCVVLYCVCFWPCISASSGSA